MSKQTKITKFFSCSANSVCNAVNGQTDNQNKRKFDAIIKSETIDNKTINTIHGLKSKFSKRGPKICPFYKKIPNTAFAVDAFNYGSIPDISIYFLTHFHSDHYHGLNNAFKHNIYCSPITASLVRHHFKKGLFTLKVIPNNVTEDVLGTKVTFFEANHCPGAVVILFELANGLRYLHTGDFRADHSFFDYELLLRRPIDTIFLDTTYCDPKYDFLPQKQILETIVSISSDFYKRNSKLLIVCGSYSIGKENVFVSIAKALHLKVWTTDNKHEIYKCYQNKEIDSLLTKQKHDSNLHVLSMNYINEEFLQKCIEESNGLYTEVLAFRPTGWEHNKNSLNGVKARKYKNITIYGVEYSEHSSFQELERFVSFFKPKRIIPTVNNENQLNRNKMNEFFNKWLKNSDNNCTDITIIPKKPKINGSITNWINKKK